MPNDTSSAAEYSKLLQQKEALAAQQQYNHPGEQIAIIPFNVTAKDKKDFKDGIQHWINLEKLPKELTDLIDRDKVVIPGGKVIVVMDYPLTNAYRFELTSANGFTREQLVNEVRKNYHLLYEEEEETATIKTIPPKERTGVYNRNQTNGKYGIWGHDIADLALAEVLVYKQDGQVVLYLNIYS